jgi:hypothetical protein
VKAYSDVLSQNPPGETLEKLQQFSKNCCSILNQLRDLGVNIKFLLPPGECLPSNLFHHQNPVTTELPNPTSHLAHTRDFPGQTKAQFCSQTTENAVKQGQGIHYSD